MSESYYEMEYFIMKSYNTIFKRRGFGEFSPTRIGVCTDKMSILRLPLANKCVSCDYLSQDTSGNAYGRNGYLPILHWPTNAYLANAICEILIGRFTWAE